MQSTLILLALVTSQTLEERADKARLHMFDMSGELQMRDEIRKANPKYVSQVIRRMSYNSEMRPRFDAARKRKRSYNFKQYYAQPNFMLVNFNGGW